jgi:hypothetical protein
MLNVSPLKGVLVIDVTGPAEQAGIRGGSRIATISGQQIPVGGDIGQRLDVPVTLGERPLRQQQRGR